jgi:hypothetical protein
VVKRSSSVCPQPHPEEVVVGSSEGDGDGCDGEGVGAAIGMAVGRVVGALGTTKLTCPFSPMNVCVGATVSPFKLKLKLPLPHPQQIPSPPLSKISNEYSCKAHTVVLTVCTKVSTFPDPAWLR